MHNLSTQCTSSASGFSYRVFKMNFFGPDSNLKPDLHDANLNAENFPFEISDFLNICGLTCALYDNENHRQGDILECTVVK